MLYLEDYMEMIENLPMEMRERFTDMRELDLKVENAMDSIEDRVKGFFKKCLTSQNLKAEWKEEQFKKLKEEYENALEDADEKVQLANQIYEMVDRYLRKLDQELSKFKMELEADHAGITELLEKRSLEMDVPPRPLHSHRAEKRKYPSSTVNSNHSDKRTTTEKVLSNLAHEAARAAMNEQPRHSTTAGSTSLFNSSSSSPALSYSLGHVGAGSNAAIAQAASRAIGATLEMSQGRRTSSLKASYAAVSQNAGLNNKDLSLGSVAPAASPLPVEPAPKSSRNKKSASRSQQQSQPATPVPPPELPTEDLLPSEGLADMDVINPISSWNVDPNEPRYCLCNDVSYGEMVGCDNEDCPIEWFHYGCVGLTQAPKGKWFCPQCTAAMKRRGRK